MIVLSNTTAQSLAPGQAITFNNVIMHTGNAECHMSQFPTSVKLRAKGIYSIDFRANVGGTAGAVCQLNVELGGQPIAETTMISTTGAAGTFNSVSGGTYVNNCCCDYDRITVVNTGTTTVTLNPNSCLRIRRVA